jgi:hypothetical protein
MRRIPHLTAVSGALLALGLTAGAGRAQLPGPRGVPGFNSPVVSPYINLLRQNNPAYLNYYGLVRPQVGFQNSIQGLEQQVNTLGDATGLQPTGPGGLGVTGHPVAFVNYLHYYTNPYGRTGFAGGAGRAGGFGGGLGTGGTAGTGGGTPGRSSSMGGLGTTGGRGLRR